MEPKIMQDYIILTTLEIINFSWLNSANGAKQLTLRIQCQSSLNLQTTIQLAMNKEWQKQNDIKIEPKSSLKTKTIPKPFPNIP